MKNILTLLLILTTGFLAQARFIKPWSCQELFDQANLVVIAKPIVTKRTSEQTTLTNISPAYHFSGVSTEFDIRVVMKGDKGLKKIILHHYELVPSPPYTDGPNLVSFDPKAHESFLMFLHRESDGRYSPVSGQVDPAFSILSLGTSVSWEWEP